MTGDDPKIAAVRAAAASNRQATEAFLKCMDTLEPLRDVQRLWCIQQLNDFVRSGLEVALPDLVPKLTDVPQLSPGDRPSATEAMQDLE